MTLPPLPEPLVMVNRYGQWASTSDGDGGVFTAAQMIAYATAAVLAEREAVIGMCDETIDMATFAKAARDENGEPFYNNDVLDAVADAVDEIVTAIRARSAV